MINKSAILLCLFAAAASADVVSFDTVDRGYYYSSDSNDPSNQNYLTGQLDDTGFNSFFGFAPLSGLNGPIVSATLSLFNPLGGYSSPNASELLTISEFTGNVTTLEAGGTVSGEYNALASGTTLGTESVSASDDGEFVTITLNSAGIAFLNANDSSAFAFGGSLGTFSDANDHYVFGASSALSAADGDTYLTVTTAPAAVPEPSMAFFILPLLVGFFVVRKFRSSPSQQ